METPSDVEHRLVQTPHVVNTSKSDRGTRLRIRTVQVGAGPTVAWRNPQVLNQAWEDREDSRLH